MHTDSVLRFVFGPAALPLGVALILYLSSAIRNGYFTSKAGSKIYKDKQPRNFWTGITIGALISALLVMSAISYFVVDKTVFEYSDNQERVQTRPSGALAPYTP